MRMTGWAKELANKKKFYLLAQSLLNNIARFKVSEIRIVYRLMDILPSVYWSWLYQKYFGDS